MARCAPRCRPVARSSRADGHRSRPQRLLMSKNPRGWTFRGARASEAISAPPHDSLGLHDDEPVEPTLPRRTERHPEGPVGVVERRSRSLQLQRGELLAQDDVLQNEVSTGTAKGSNGADEQGGEEDDASSHSTRFCPHSEVTSRATRILRGRRQSSSAIGGGARNSLILLVDG